MNVLRYSYESKLASAAVVAMLALSGIFAAFLIIPRVTAASGPSITLTPSSGTVGTSVTVFGTGFAPSSDITITMTTSSTTSATLTPSKNSLIDTSASPNQLMTDADGNFEATFVVPPAAGGSQTVTAMDAKGNSATATFTVQPSVTLTDGAGHPITGGFPDQVLPGTPTFVVTGFGSSEQLVFSQSIFGSVATTTTNQYGSVNVPFSGPGSLSPTWSTTVPLTTGGAKTITVTGATSGLSASVTFTVNAAVAFYSSQTSSTVFAVNPSQYQTFYLQGFGFPKGTIAANSITINGQTVQNPAITVGSDGTFGLNPGSRVPVSFPVGLAQGPASITIGGQTFSYANGNIVCASSSFCPSTVFGTATPSHTYVGVGWGDPLILSAGAGVPTIVLDQSSYVPDGSTVVTVFGFGGWSTGTPTVTSNAAGLTSFTHVATSSNAFYAYGNLWGTPGFDSSGSPLTYTVTATQGSNTATATFGITQAVEATPCKADYRTNVGSSSCNVKAYGFAQGETVNLYIGSKSIGTGTADPTTGSVSTFTTLTPINLPAGKYAFKAVGVTSAASAVSSPLITYTPAVYQPTGRPGDLTVDSGPAGTATVLVSGNDYGVHGLNASTTYQLAWGIGPNAQVITTFTTDANGMIPGAGVQFTVPAGTAGVHILSIRNSAGKDVVFGNVAAGDATNNAPGSAGGTIYKGQYGDLLFALSANIQLSPTGGGVGTVVTVSGTALSAGTTYYVYLQAPNLPPEGVYRATFTATSTGSVPAGVNFTFPAEPTFGGTNNENGTAYSVCVGTASQFQSGNSCPNSVAFMLHATASLNATTASPGQAVTVSALGLQSATSYTVVFNKQVVATFTTNTVGSGSATFTVPTGTAPGTYQVKILRSDGKGALLTPPTLTVTSGAVVTTQSLTPSTPTQTTLNGQPAVAVSYTNTLSVSVTSVVYAVVTNSAGQVVYYTTATITVSPGSSQTAYAVLAGLPHGTYTVTLFAIVNNQVASTTTTTQVTI